MNSIVREIHISDITEEELSPEVKKVKKIFEELFEGLEQFDSKGHPGDIFFIKNDKIYMWQDTQNKILWCSYKYIWSFFETEFGYNDNEISKLVQGMLETHLKRKVFTTKALDNWPMAGWDYI
jgi:hypothetical protein